MGSHCLPQLNMQEVIKKEHYNFFNVHQFSYVRACSHGGGGPQIGVVPRLGGVTNLSIESLSFVLFCFVLFFFEYFHIRGGVSVLHVNAEGGVG